MVTNIEFEAIVTSIKSTSFIRIWLVFFNILDLNHHKYQMNGTVRDEIYTGKLLFSMKEFVSFGTYCQSMFSCQPDP